MITPCRMSNWNYLITSSSAMRNGSLEYARFVGALAIIWFHMGLPYHQTALAALPLFILLQVIFGLGRSLGGQARRLLVPWLFWSAVYGVFKIAQALVMATPIHAEFALWMVLTGPSLHLWYLPFSFVAVLGATYAHRFLSEPALAVLALVASVGGLFVFSTETLPVPFAQWASVLPAVFVALYLYRIPAKLCVLLAAIVVLEIVVFGLSLQGGGWQILVALCVAALALALPTANTAVSAHLGGVSFGLYLIHPAVYALLNYAVPSLRDWMFVPVVVASLGGTYLLQRVMPRMV